MFKSLAEKVKQNPFRLVFTEGTDSRILEAASRLEKDKLLTPILIGNVDEVKAAAKENNFDIEGILILDPLNYDKFDEMVDLLVELRKGKMDKEQWRSM